MGAGHLPTFILVGAMKCGTTSLHNYLDEHPQICMSTPKEPNFFTADSEKNLDWYQQRFHDEAQEFGESSTNYTKYPEFPGVPERMYRLLPDVKLLYLVRDPIQRAISHYVHNRIHKREDRPIEEAFLPAEESHYLQTSRYYMQISRYLEYYSRERVLILESEDLRARRTRVMKTIFDFLEVEMEVDEAEFEKEYHATSKKLNPNLSVFLRHTQIGKALTSVGQSVLPDALIEKGLEAFRSDVDRPSLEGDTKEAVHAYMEKDVEQLRRLCRRGFEAWSL
jgi:hypothetical protein